MKYEPEPDQEPEEDHMRDLSQSVNRACERWLAARGMASKQIQERKRLEKEADKMRSEILKGCKCK